MKKALNATERALLLAAEKEDVRTAVRGTREGVDTSKERNAVFMAVETILATRRGAVVESIHNELVCGCVEEYGETYQQGEHHASCWYAHLASRLAEKGLS